MKKAQQRNRTTVTVLCHTNLLSMPVRSSPTDERPRICRLLESVHGLLQEGSAVSGPKRRQGCPLHSSCVCIAETSAELVIQDRKFTWHVISDREPQYLDEDPCGVLRLNES